MGKVVEFPQLPGSPVVRPVAKPLWRHVLGEVLRGERLEQQRILTEVAATAGVSPQYLSEVERGRKEPSSEVLGSVAQALGLELVDVVARVAGRLGAVRDDRLRHERETHSRRRGAPVDVTTPAQGHPLDLSGAGEVHQVSGVVGPGVSSAEVFLLVA
jgi:transcriptional regulator with XRE-family HTH domain